MVTNENQARSGFYALQPEIFFAIPEWIVDTVPEERYPESFSDRSDRCAKDAVEGVATENEKFINTHLAKMFCEGFIRKGVVAILEENRFEFLMVVLEKVGQEVVFAVTTETCRRETCLSGYPDSPGGFDAW